MLSPTFFNHRVTVPSETLSPRAGISRSVPVAVGSAGAEVGTGGVDRAGGSVATCGVERAGVVLSAFTGSSEPVASPPSAITASSSPTRATWSTATTIFCKIPAAGEGISVSTLSVETSSKGSSRFTWSPSALSQRVTVPSVTLSPSAGIFTENDI